MQADISNTDLQSLTETIQDLTLVIKYEDELRQMKESKGKNSIDEPYRLQGSGCETAEEGGLRLPV